MAGDITLAPGVTLSFYDEPGPRKSPYPPPCLYERHPDGSITVLAPTGSSLLLGGRAARAFVAAREWPDSPAPPSHGRG